MSKKSTTTSSTDNTNNFNATTTPSNPEWVTKGIGDLGGSVLDLAKSDPYSYVAGPNALQTQAGGTAAHLTGSPWNFDGAANTMRNVMGQGANTYDPFTVKAASVLDNLPAYMNPYTNDVVNTTLRGFDQNANQTRAQQMLDLGNDSTFGGSGGSILRAQTEGQLGLSRAQTEAQLRDQAFNTGAGLASGDADRKTQTRLADMAAINGAGQFNAGQRDLAAQRQMAAATGLGDLSSAYDANQRANIAAQAGIGGTLQGIDQTRAGAPLALAGLTSGLFGNLPLNLLHGQVQNGTSTGTSNSTGTEKQSGASLGDWLNYFASNAKAAAASGG